MAVGSPQVRLRGLASSRFENPTRFRESLVTMPAAKRKISSWNHAGLTGSRITMAGLGLARPPCGPGVVPGLPAARNHLPLWLRFDALPKISLQPYCHPAGRPDRSGSPLFPLIHLAWRPPFVKSFSGVWLGKSREAPIFPQEDLRYKSFKPIYLLRPRKSRNSTTASVEPASL